jgi:AcrR family transcriptional regulator
MTSAAPPAPLSTEQFRNRLLGGLSRSIEERGYQETTVTDIVRHARASRRTFYQVFATKDDCFVALMESANQGLQQRIAEAVDPDAPWREQARQAVDAYIEQVADKPSLSLCWIREFPSLGTVAHRVRRDAMDAIAGLVQRLSGNERFRQGGLAPVTRELAIIILGGLRELTASVVEDGGDVREVREVAVAATIALLETSRA